jgi:hypothetical protein
MIILHDEFFRVIDKYPVDLKGRILEAAIKLTKNKKLGRGVRKKGTPEDRYFDAAGKKYQLKFYQDGEDYIITDIWTHDIDKRSQTQSGQGRTTPAVRQHHPLHLGFSKKDFEILQSAFNIPEKLSEEDYFNLISRTTYPKLKWLGDRVAADLWSKLGIRLYPQLAEKGDIGRDPVVWLAFTRSEDHYESQVQLTFHLGIGECIHEAKDRRCHFCTKLALFHNKPDTRRFWANVKNHPETAIQTIKKYTMKLPPTYEIQFYRKKTEPPEKFSARSERDYLEVLVDYLNPDYIKKGFFGLNFNRYHHYYDDNVADCFSDLEWVASYLIREFSDLMYLYFWFSADDPLKKIEEYKKRKIAFDNTLSQAS